MAAQISMGARREIAAAVVERYCLAGRAKKGWILDELYAGTGRQRKHAVRTLGGHPATDVTACHQRTPTYGPVIKDALTALWESSDRIRGKRLKVMIPALLAALESHGRLKLTKADRAVVLAVSAATIDRMLGDAKITLPVAVSAEWGSTRQSAVRCRSGRSTTGRSRRRVSARSIWLCTAELQSPARLSRL